MVKTHGDSVRFSGGVTTRPLHGWRLAPGTRVREGLGRRPSAGRAVLAPTHRGVSLHAETASTLQSAGAASRAPIAVLIPDCWRIHSGPGPYKLSGARVHVADVVRVGVGRGEAPASGEQPLRVGSAHGETLTSIEAPVRACTSLGHQPPRFSPRKRFLPTVGPSVRPSARVAWASGTQPRAGRRRTVPLRALRLCVRFGVRCGLISNPFLVVVKWDSCVV